MNQGAAGDQNQQRGGNSAGDAQLSALAGLEAGVIGGAAMFLFLAAHSALRGHPWWTYANLLGSMAYGNSALWRGLGKATLAGLAVQVLSCGIAGVLFGLCFARTRGRLTSLILGLTCGILWFFISYRMVFQRTGPLVPMYASQPATLMGHLILGLVLSRTSALRAEWPAGWRLFPANRPQSGIPGASQALETNEIVSGDQLE